MVVVQVCMVILLEASKPKRSLPRADSENCYISFLKLCVCGGLLIY